ncbi:flavin reductase family protein [Pseudomonas thivervalensis]|uniref:flavin reductase family protein n=1 Tax=Pseudomonas thivervalensis TaxID=86265 RepID=UPI003D6A3CB2
MTSTSIRPWFDSVAPPCASARPVGVDGFRGAMRQLAGAVTIVTSSDEQGACGLTATAVCSLSADPPRILCCVNLAGRTFQVIGQSRRLAINVLQAGQMDLAMAFAGREEKTFDSEHWTHAATGAPILREALVSFDCAVAEMFVMPTHALIVGEIRHISYLDRLATPLAYQNGQYMTFAATSAGR